MRGFGETINHVSIEGLIVSGLRRSGNNFTFRLKTDTGFFLVEFDRSCPRTEWFLLYRVGAWVLVGGYLASRQQDSMIFHDTAIIADQITFTRL